MTDEPTADEGTFDTADITLCRSQLKEANDWSSSSVSDADIAAFDADIASGDPKRIKAAIARAKRLYAAYQADRYPEPK